MEKHFALVNKNIVKAVIVADDAFLPSIKSDYDCIIDVTYRGRPSTGDSYYPNVDQFISDAQNTYTIPVDLKAEHLRLGTENGFESFMISKYLVKYEDGMIHIGCKKYSAPGFLDALHHVLVEKQLTISIFTTVNGPAHGRFGISWEDAQKLYDALIKVKF